jgi:hypothetical protein
VEARGGSNVPGLKMLIEAHLGERKLEIADFAHVPPIERLIKCRMIINVAREELFQGRD